MATAVDARVAVPEGRAPSERPLEAVADAAVVRRAAHPGDRLRVGLAR